MSTKYLNAEGRSYAMYVLFDRQIPDFTDGLKPSGRRVLWVAKNGEKFKVSTLGGSSMHLHPHSPPEDAIFTLAAKYGNNISYFTGDGAFGTILAPNSYGAARYVSVTLSKFAKDNLLKDLEIIPMKENYDSSCMEPIHFLPLVAPVCLNPQEGIGWGFSSTILGRNPENIINNQISYLEGKNFYNTKPALIPINQYAINAEFDKDGQERWVFNGEIKILNSTDVIVTNLPYGTAHAKYIKYLNNLIEKEKIIDYDDDSKNYYKITIKFKRGIIKEIGEDNLLKYLGLINTVCENFTVIDPSGEKVLETNYSDYVKQFTDWRLKFYPKRHERLKSLALLDLQKYQDIIKAIDKNLGSVARKLENKDELREYCKEIGIVNIEYIADLPTYRFTIEEKNKAENKIKELKSDINNYESIIKSDKKQREIYIQELEEIKTNYKKGKYD